MNRIVHTFKEMSPREMKEKRRILKAFNDQLWSKQGEYSQMKKDNYQEAFEVISEIIARIRCALNLNFILTGNACNYLMQVAGAPQPNEEFVRKVVHEAFSTSKGYVPMVTKVSIDHFIDDHMMHENKLKEQRNNERKEKVNNLKETWEETVKNMDIVLKKDSSVEQSMGELFLKDRETHETFIVDIAERLSDLNQSLLRLKDLQTKRQNKMNQNKASEESDVKKHKIEDQQSQTTKKQKLKPRNKSLEIQQPPTQRANTNLSISDTIETKKSKAKQSAPKTKGSVDKDLEETIRAKVFELKNTSVDDMLNLRKDEQKDTNIGKLEVPPENILENVSVKPQSEIDDLKKEEQKEVSTQKQSMLGNVLNFPELTEKTLENTSQKGTGEMGSQATKSTMSQGAMLNQKKKTAQKGTVLGKPVKKETEKTKKQGGKKQKETKQEDMESRIMIAVQKVEESVELIQEKLESLSKNTDLHHLKQISELPLNEKKERIKFLRKNTISLADKLTEHLLSLDELVESSEKVNPKKKQQVNEIRKILGEVEQIGNKLKKMEVEIKNQENQKQEKEIKTMKQNLPEIHKPQTTAAKPQQKQTTPTKQTQKPKATPNKKVAKSKSQSKKKVPKETAAPKKSEAKGERNVEKKPKETMPNQQPSPSPKPSEDTSSPSQSKQFPQSPSQRQQTKLTRKPQPSPQFRPMRPSNEQSISSKDSGKMESNVKESSQDSLLESSQEFQPDSQQETQQQQQEVSHGSSQESSQEESQEKENEKEEIQYEGIDDNYQNEYQRQVSRFTLPTKEDWKKVPYRPHFEVKKLSSKYHLQSFIPHLDPFELKVRELPNSLNITGCRFPTEQEEKVLVDKLVSWLKNYSFNIDDWTQTDFVRAIEKVGSGSFGTFSVTYSLPEDYDKEQKISAFYLRDVLEVEIPIQKNFIQNFFSTFGIENIW